MNKDEMFEFLDSVRESGHINMFGAAPLLQEVFGLSRFDAKDTLLEWMQTFNERKQNSHA